MKRLPLFFAILFAKTLLFAQPVITSFTPASGPVGSTVTITGSGFSATPANNLVDFGAVKAPVSAATSTTLTVTVPSEATYQPISVTTNNLTAYSAVPFVVTFGGGGGALTAAAFKPKLGITTGIYPHAVVVADFNGDGKADLFVSRGSSATVAVLANTSSGGRITFASQTDLPATGTDHEGAAVADLDGDGKPDIVVTNGVSAASVSVYRNTSAGAAISFASRLDFPVVNGPYAVAIGDLDGDGKPDLAIANNEDNTVSIYKNTSTPGAISFGSRIDLTVGTNPYGIAIGDLDGDGKADLAVTTEGSSSALFVLQNTSSAGTISFNSPVNYGVLNGAFIVAIGDLDGDGRSDLAAVNGGNSNTVAVFLNTGSAGSLSFAPQQDFATGSYPDGIALSDVDGDGKPDLVTDNNLANTVSVLRNTSTTGHLSFDTNSDYTVGAGPLYVAVADLDGDGRPDIIAANSSETTISILQSQVGVTGVVPVISSFAPDTAASDAVVRIRGTNFTGAVAVTFGGMAAASFTVDSATGITAVVATGASGSVGVTTGYGIASLPGFVFEAPVLTDTTPPVITSFSPVLGPPGTVVTITGAYFTNRPDSDIVFFGSVRAVVTAATVTQLQVIVPTGATYQPLSVTTGRLTGWASVPFVVTFPNDSTTITTASFAPAGNFTTGAYPVAVVFSDLDGDGKPELITANANANSLSILRNTSLPGIVAFNQKIDLAAGADPVQVVTGDLDGDGKPDIVTVNFNSGNAGTISVYGNTSTRGNLSFTAGMSYTAGNGSTGIAMADMNGDGRPDIIVASGNSGLFSIFPNTTIAPGPISFGARVDYYLPTHADQVTAADLDNDGRPDLVISGFSGGSISVFRNTSVGGVLSLGPEVDYPVGVNPTFVSVGDLDGDGELDVAVVNYTSGSVTLYKNYSSPGSITLGGRQDMSWPATNLSFTDLNGDGKIDLATGIGLNGKAAVIENSTVASGAFAFAPAVDFTTGSYDTYSAVADVDGDGKPDLAVVNTTDNTVTILTRNTIGSPVITAVSDTAAGKGSTVTLTGTGFTGATVVTFGGTPADSFRVLSSTQIEAVVGRGESGNITVTTPLGTGSLAGFRFIPGIGAGGATSFCAGDSVLLVSTAADNNEWLKDGVAIGVAAGSSLEAGVSGLYTVETTANGITTTSDSGILVTASAPQAPVITAKGSILLSSDSAGNQWYFNGSPIAGATLPTLQPVQEGSYTVSALAGGCASAISAPYHFVAASQPAVNFYPNPMTTQLTIDWVASMPPVLTVAISDLQGRQIQVIENVQAGTVIDVAGLSPGMYFIKVYSSNPFKVYKTERISKMK